MNRRTGAIAVAALLGILLVVATAVLGGPRPAPTEVPPSVAVATGVASPSAVATAPPPPASTAAMPSDFNGDGFADLVIGIPRQDLAPFEEAGSVHVLYGSIDGLTRAGNQVWNRDSPDVLGSADEDDHFGTAIASGDFDGDGFADLAVGAPDLGFGTDAGGVNVLFGSPGGLSSEENELWTVADLPGVPPNHNVAGGLGAALASGDFDGDGFADLAIASTGVDDVASSAAGVVVLLHGGTEGLGFRGAWLSRADMGFSQPSVYALGRVLAAGDLNGDGLDDLAAAAGGGVGARGQVVVFYGSRSGLTGAGSQRWRQDSLSARGTSFVNDEFGAALAVGDFDGDAFGDLAVGAPLEGLECVPRCQGAGAVHIIRGSADGLTSDSNQLWSEGTPGVPGNDEKWDLFGRALAAGDFDGDGADDLAIGAPGEDASRRSEPNGKGAVTVLYGTRDGLSASRAQQWTQDNPGVANSAVRGEAFGASLASGRFGGSTFDDIAIGVPRQRLLGVTHAGLVHVLFGRLGGLDAQGAQAWSKDTRGVEGVPVDEHYGETLGA
jgi:hypothetical protein